MDAWGFCAAGNIPSYRDQRIKGFGPLLLGLLSFYALCLVGAVWNYAASSVFTWRHP